MGFHTLLSCCCCVEQRYVPFIVHMCPRFSKTALVPGIWSPALCLVARLSLFVTPMNCNPPSFSSLSMEFSREEYWSELPCPLPGNHPDPGIESRSSTCRSKNPGGFFIVWVTREATITGEAFKTMPSLIPHHGDSDYVGDHSFFVVLLRSAQEELHRFTTVDIFRLRFLATG